MDDYVRTSNEGGVKWKTILRPEIKSMEWMDSSFENGTRNELSEDGNLFPNGCTELI
jgi:hypothetical protein